MIGRLLALAFPATSLFAQAPAARSAAISDVQYDVTFDSSTATDRQLKVKMSFRTSGSDPVLLSLPAWTPGAYQMSYFARKVENFTATADSRELHWDKLDYDTWRVEPGGSQSITVAFDYLADTLDNAAAWSAPDFVLFNGTNVFLYPEGRPFDFPARVVLHTQPGWIVATSMARTGAGNEFTAPNYHDLVDMPMFVGRVELDSAQIAGKWYRLASYPAGSLTGPLREAFWNQMRQFMPPEIAVTGETPWDVYTVMMIFEASSFGGSALEHQSSHVGVYTPRIIGNPVLASISAHEIFHAWNVKRLRPADMWPYDYSRPQPTTLLWVSEGITDYYADLALVRGGVISPAQFFQTTTGKIQDVASRPPTALEDASLTTWIHPVDGSEYIYYPKGSLAGLLLDVLIRDASDNRGSLDVVIRDLYHAFYQSGKGFTSGDWWQAVTRAAGGKSFDDFYRRYVDGREPFPYADVLPLAGLHLRADTARVARLGTRTVPDSSGVRVAAVTPGSSAADAGVAVGDHLLKVGDVDVRDPNFGELFRAHYGRQPEGTPLAVVVRRGAETLTLNARLRFAQDVGYAVVADPGASSKAARIRDGILKGALNR
jgi:predicted metalloprotease with PDZ domain